MVKVPILIVERRGPELNPDSRQSACRWQHAWSWTLWWAATISHQAHNDTHMHIINPAVGCHYFLLGPQLPSQPSGVTAFRPVPTYIAWWQRHIGVRNLHTVFTPCARPRIEPMASWSQVRRSTDSAMTPPNETLAQHNVPRCYIANNSDENQKIGVLSAKSYSLFLATVFFIHMVHSWITMNWLNSFQRLLQACVQIINRSTSVFAHKST